MNGLKFVERFTLDDLVCFFLENIFFS